EGPRVAARPRLRHPRGRQGVGGTRPGAPDQPAAGDVGPAGAGRRRDRGAVAAHTGAPCAGNAVTTVELIWRASPLTRSIATCAAAAIVASLLAGRWELAAFAAPLLGVLCSIGWQRGEPTVTVQAE